MATSNATVQTTFAPETTRSRPHLAWLDSLRAMAAIYVMVSHIATTSLPRTYGLRGLTLLLAGPFRYGHLAVGLFIVISGFSLMLPVTRSAGQLRGGALQFFYRRAKRILPTYYAALLISILFAKTIISHRTGGGWDIAIPVTNKDIWLHLAMLQDIWDHAKINHAMWSISVEWRIYFLFPLLVLAFVRFGAVKTTLATFVLATLAFLCVWHTVFVNMMQAYVGLFALGMCAAEIAFGSQSWAVKARTDLPWKWIALGIFVVEAAVQYHWRTYMFVQRMYILDIINGLFSAVLILAVASAPNGRLSRFLCWKPLAFIGTFAYSIYLMHAPLVQIVWQYGVQRLHLAPTPAFLTTAVGGGAAIIAFSYLFFLAFERPFLNTKQRTDRLVPVPAGKAGS